MTWLRGRPKKEKGGGKQGEGNWGE